MVKPDRMEWTPELHAQFVAAVNRLGGLGRAMPAAILEEMALPGLTRHQVKSHLQKYSGEGKSSSNATAHHSANPTTAAGPHQGLAYMPAPAAAPSGPSYTAHVVAPMQQQYAGCVQAVPCVGPSAPWAQAQPICSAAPPPQPSPGQLQPYAPMEQQPYQQQRQPVAQMQQQPSYQQQPPPQQQHQQPPQQSYQQQSYQQQSYQPQPQPQLPPQQPYQQQPPPQHAPPQQYSQGSYCVVPPAQPLQPQAQQHASSSCALSSGGRLRRLIPAHASCTGHEPAGGITLKNGTEADEDLWCELRRLQHELASALDEHITKRKRVPCADGHALKQARSLRGSVTALVHKYEQLQALLDS